MIQRPTISTILSEKGLHGALYLAGEVLFITRPLFYVLFIRKYGTRSWIPWFLSLAVDFVGMGILSKVTKSGGHTEEQQFHLSVSENDEVWVFLNLTMYRELYASGCILLIRLLR